MALAKLLTVEEVAEALGVHWTTIWRWVREGEFPVNRHGILPPERRRTLTPRLGEERDPARRSGAGGGDGPGPAPVRR